MTARSLWTQSTGWHVGLPAQERSVWERMVWREKEKFLKVDESHTLCFMKVTVLEEGHFKSKHHTFIALRDGARYQQRLPGWSSLRCAFMAPRGDLSKGLSQ